MQPDDSACADDQPCAQKKAGIESIVKEHHAIERRRNQLGIQERR
jgi:hypothetical protein